MSESASRDYIPSKETEGWKNYTVGVMGAARERPEAVINGREVGKILAEMGYDVANGGYAMGGMGATAEGFQETCKNQGLSDEEIAAHFQAVVFPDNLKGEREYIEPATRHAYHTFTSRTGGIIDRSDAVITLTGGAGTIMENDYSAMEEWLRLREFKAAKKKDIYTDIQRPFPRPIIIIDSKNTAVKELSLLESESPDTINNISDDIYILAGHKLENGEVANLQNDPQMREELKMILEVYEAAKNPERILSSEESQKEYNSRMDEIQKKVKRFVLLKDVVKRKKHVFDNLGDDWGAQ